MPSINVNREFPIAKALYLILGLSFLVEINNLVHQKGIMISAGDED